MSNTEQKIAEESAQHISKRLKLSKIDHAILKADIQSAIEKATTVISNQRDDLAAENHKLRWSNKHSVSPATASENETELIGLEVKKDVESRPQPQDDTKRLDWLESRKEMSSLWSRDDGKWEVECNPPAISGIGTTLREAIDAAMRKEK